MKNNITKITKKDLACAIEVAKNGSPCCQRQVLDNDPNAHCVMGCVMAGIAKNRHMSWADVQTKLINAYGVAQLLGIGTKIINKNDSFFYGKPKSHDNMLKLRNKSDIQEVKNWQIKELTKLMVRATK